MQHSTPKQYTEAELILDVSFENEKYLTEQIITYIGNKRALLGFIGDGIAYVKKRIGAKKLKCLDLFSGSGIVARFFKQHASFIYVNDLEDYSRLINNCYLTNKSSVDFDLLRNIHTSLQRNIEQNWSAGFIREMYSPKDENNIQPGERVFYTVRNATYIDTARKEIGKLPEDLQKFFLATLLYGASVHNNTSGVFKGFYKNKDGIGQYGGTGRNALRRILGDINIEIPLFSNFECDYQILQEDAIEAVEKADEVDIAYLDPPYNQHPYGSNYFMLNLILNYQGPAEYSKVSGIPTGWHHSKYNRKKEARDELFKVVENVKAKFILISYNSEGFVGYDAFVDELSKLGNLRVLSTDYNTFRGCRNLENRDAHVKEFLFLLEKK